LINNILPPIKKCDTINKKEAVYMLHSKINTKDSKHYLQKDIDNSFENKCLIETSKNKMKNNHLDQDKYENKVNLNENKIGKEQIIINKRPLNENSNLYNLKLPQLHFHQKSKSHFDILESLNKDLKLQSCNADISMSYKIFLY